MNVVVHDGECAEGDRGRLVDALGPNGLVARDRRMEPGFLGSLLLVRRVPDEDPAADRTGFVLLEMWDEAIGAPPVELSRNEALQIIWIAPPRVMSAIR